MKDSTVRSLRLMAMPYLVFMTIIMCLITGYYVYLYTQGIGNYPYRNSSLVIITVLYVLNMFVSILLSRSRALSAYRGDYLAALPLLIIWPSVVIIEPSLVIAWQVLYYVGVAVSLAGYLTLLVIVFKELLSHSPSRKHAAHAGR